jgi:hypothetical protein
VTTKRGGARPGAGRKPVGAAAETSVLLTAEQHAIAAALGGGTVAAGIRRALDMAAEQLAANQGDKTD